MEGFVYIALASNNSYYVGSTTDVIKRIAEHNSGKTKSLANKLPIKLVFFQKYRDIKKARQIEYKLKRFKSRKIIDQIILDGIIEIN